jgi:hypothetical protein
MSDGRRVLVEIAVFRRDGAMVRVVPAWRYDRGPVDGWAYLADLLGPFGRGDAP